MANFESLITLTQVADGAQGPAADEYRVEAEQEEILKFQESIDNFIFSPKELSFYLVKSNQKISSKIVGVYILNTSFDDVLPNIYNDFPSIITEEEMIHTLHIENILSIQAKDEMDEFKKNYYSSLSNAIKTSDVVFKIEIEAEGKKIYKTFSCRAALSVEMLKLSINASNLNASMRESELEFSEDGLSITNGNFIIYKREEIDGQTSKVPVLYFDETTKKLTISGRIEAQEGYFSGQLNSPLGEIGGFYIGQNCIYTATSPYIYTEVSANNVNTNNYTNYYIKDGENFIIPSEYNAELQYYIKEENLTNSPLILNGNSGNIIAKNIELGAGATIEDFIQLGDNAFLYNPAKHENIILKSGNIELNQTGLLKLGTIEAYGGETDENENIISAAYIQSKNGNWRIFENGQAEFKDIYANNVHLSDTILEIGTVQNVGSLMIFKDAWAPVSFGTKIENGEEREDRYSLIFDSLTSLNIGDWIYNGKQYYQIKGLTELSNENKKYHKITLDRIYNENIEKVISKFGATQDTYNVVAANEVSENNFKEYYIETNNEGIKIYIHPEVFNEEVIYYKKKNRDFVFSIYGESENDINSTRNYKFASPYSITLSDFDMNTTNADEVLTFNKHLILGQLDNNKTKNGLPLSGIGLYCDNAHLEGSLTAEGPIEETGENFYSGIHTSQDILMPDKDGEGNIYFPGAHTGNILLWAGAKGTDSSSIQAAPFRVDSLGNFYAGSGYFKGSIISEATITASVMEAVIMRTAILEGWSQKDQQSAALKIMNTENSTGIGFYERVDGGFNENNNLLSDVINTNDKLIFNINSNGFKAGEVEFIKIDGGISNIISNGLGKTRKEFISSFSGDDLEIKYQTIETIEGSTSTSIGFNFVVNNILNLKYGEEPLIKLSDNQTIFETDMSFNKNISYSSIMNYEKVDNGYDLYIN